MRLAFLLALRLYAQVPPTANAPAPDPFIRENYSKFDHYITMRDGVRLFTSVYIPKDVFTDARSYPILLQRTPYSVSPYGSDKYPERLGPSTLFSREKYIFAYQDVRGRNMSEGVFTLTRPFKPAKASPKDTDESSDAYDTIEWLVKNLPGNTGKVGIWGISQPGFFASAALIDSHPALVAVSPQAPVSDYYLNDDSYHNGAFMLAHRFRFYSNFKQRLGGPAPPAPPGPGFDFGTPDGYDFYLRLGSLANAEEKYFKRTQPFWTDHMDHTTYDEYWKSRSIWRHFQPAKPAVLTVGGWYDTEDPIGPLRIFKELEKAKPQNKNLLVMGPWNHGGFARGDGDRLGQISFGSKTAVFYRERIEFPFFQQMLKGKGEGNPAKAWVFETGVNQWRRFDAWPPQQAKAFTLHLAPRGQILFTAPAKETVEEYVSDPAKPVPYVPHVSVAVRNDYMVEDQRFAASRPDVLVFETEPLEQDLTVMGPLQVHLKVATSGTDSDFVVKLIDVYPGDYPGLNLGGYQQLVRGEPFRGKYRKSLDKPVAFIPNQPDHIRFELPDIAHAFRRGHRLMVQIQSSWFPLTDRNPQQFMEIPKARNVDFQKATQQIFLGGADGTRIELKVVN
ncbi:MAG: CocE/NonD family hydrolase [Acidobacteriota bacterium]